jgi:hypothetical protein
MCTLAQRCRAEGRESDARWVLDHAYHRVPFLFSGNAALLSFKTRVRGVLPERFATEPSERESQPKTLKPSTLDNRADKFKERWLKVYKSRSIG